MGLFSNGVEKGVLRMEGNKKQKPGEDSVYHKFFLEADKTLQKEYGLPRLSWYMFTDTELERYITKTISVTDCEGITLGNMYYFYLGTPCVITKVKCGDEEKVVRLPISVVKRTLERTLKNAEDATKLGPVDLLRL